MRIYIERDRLERDRVKASGFTPRRMVEHLEGPRGGKSLIAMYEARDAGEGVGGVGVGVELPQDGVEVGLATGMGADGGERVMTWGAGAWEWLDGRVGAAEKAWGSHAGARWVWPRAGEVLSDVPSVRRFLKEREGRQWRFVLDPVGMLAESMVGNAEEHVRRMLETLGSHEACGAVVLSDFTVDARAEVRVRVPIGAGELTRRGLLEWWRKNCGAGTPVILGCDVAMAEQAAWLTSG